MRHAAAAGRLHGSAGTNAAGGDAGAVCGAHPAQRAAVYHLQGAGSGAPVGADAYPRKRRGGCVSAAFLYMSCLMDPGRCSTPYGNGMLPVCDRGAGGIIGHGPAGQYGVGGPGCRPAGVAGHICPAVCLRISSKAPGEYSRKAYGVCTETRYTEQAGGGFSHH